MSSPRAPEAGHEEHEDHEDLEPAEHHQECEQQLGNRREIGVVLCRANDPQAGVYLVELELYSTDGAVESSEPFWIVFNNEASEEDHEAAIEWVEENLAGEEHCHGDIDDDHDVDVSDLLAVIENWGPCPDCSADIDGNGVVEVDDLLELLSEFGECH